VGLARLRSLLLLATLTTQLPSLAQAADLPAALPGSGSSLAGLQAQAEEKRRQIDALALRQRHAEQAQRRRETDFESLAGEIERLKSQPEGVARDLALNEKLALSQAQAAVLSRESAALRQGGSELRAARQQLVSLCDRILRTEGDAGLSAGQRLLWLRLRTAQVEALLPAATTPSGAVLGSASAAISAAATASTTVDDPQALREQADLLRDSVDKLRREVERLAARSEELRRRERLRERASRVDEDLFAEQATARRRGGAAALRAGAEAAPSADSAGGVFGMPSASPSTTPPQATPRTGPDPSTLDALLRSEGAGDPAAKQQALQRARGELEALAGDLLRRATQLEQRASDLSKQK
jgi:hypothetical protein